MKFNCISSQRNNVRFWTFRQLISLSFPLHQHEVNYINSFFVQIRIGLMNGFSFWFFSNIFVKKTRFNFFVCMYCLCIDIVYLIYFICHNFIKIKFFYPTVSCSYATTGREVFQPPIKLFYKSNFDVIVTVHFFNLYKSYFYSYV